MKSMIVVALALLAVAVALPTDQKVVQLLKSNFDQQPDGAYQYGYETDDGTSRSEQGELKEALDEENKPHVVVTVRGTYSYKNVDGSIETVNYFADENGFHAEGPSIPKPTRR